MLEFDRFLCIAASANPLSVKEIVIGLALYPLFLFMADDRLNGSCLMPNDDWLGLKSVNDWFAKLFYYIMGTLPIGASLYIAH